MRTRALKIGSVLALVLLAGCDKPSDHGVGRRPYPDYMAPVVFSDEDKVPIITLSAQHPDSFAKLQELHKQYTGMHAERRKECEQAANENVKIMQFGGFTKDEAKAAVHTHLIQHGWPEDDPIVKGVEVGQ